MPPSVYNRIRRRRRRCDYGLISCSVVFLLSSITSVVCVAKSKSDRHNYTNQHRRPASSLSLSASSSSLLSFRGGSSSSNSQRNQSSLSKNDNNNEKSPFEYIPINALNNYGQSTQLRHAMEAASRYGTPIIACLCSVDEEDEIVVCNTDDVEMDTSNSENQRRENAIVICSLQRPRMGVVAPSVPTGASSTNIRRYSTNVTPNNVHPSIQGLVKILATRDDVDNIDAATQTNHDGPTHTLHTAIVSTGIQSDATFLLNQLQRHFSKFWFRYNTLPSNTIAVVKMIQEVLLDCMGYDWSEEVGSAKISGGVGSAAPSYNENEDESNGSSVAGRPLGLSSFLLSLANDDATTTTSSSFTPRPTITLIEANGSSEQYVARSMGVGAQKANELLSQKWKRGMSLVEVKDMIQEVLQEVAIERGWLPGHDEDTSSGSTMHTELIIACETLTTRGIDIEFLPLQRVKSRL